MAEEKQEVILALIKKNSDEVGPGGQGKMRGVINADAHDYPGAQPTGEVNIRLFERERTLLCAAEKLQYPILTLEDKLAATKFVAAEGDPHLLVDNAICSTCPAQWCLVVCPAQRYSKDAAGMIHVDSEGCFECGTCRVACLPGGLYWKYPLGGFGVCYRQG